MSRPRLHIPEPLRSAARRARKANWTVTSTGSGHLAWTSPEGVTVITASTPGCHRGNANARARLRRAGLRLERP